MESKELNKEQFDEAFEKANFDYQEYISTFVEGTLSKIFSDGILQETDMEDLKKYFSNPDLYQKELENLAHYYYISNGETFQLFDMAKILPTLNYKISAFDKNKSYEKSLVECNKVLHKVKHRPLTRDIITNLVSSGTMCGIWLGDKKNPYFYIFDNLKYVFPSYRLNGTWVVTVDLEWLDLMQERARINTLKNLKPYITESMYNAYISDKSNYDKKYIDLPIDRAVAIRTHTLKRNQNLGLTWFTQGVYDIMHKKKLRDLEKSVANKIIRSIAILTIGSNDDKDGKSKNLNLPKGVKTKLFSRVKQALNENTKSGLSLIAIPEFADITFPEIKGGDILDPDKMESINNDILASFGISSALLNGSGANFASAKLNLEIFYKRISVLLEEIDVEVYGRLFNLILPTNQKDNFVMNYDKEPPISNKEKIDILMKLHAQEGFSLKAVLDSLNGVDFDEYISQSIFEQDELKLPEKIQPYASAYTATDYKNGRPSVDNPTNENSEKAKGNDSNALPD